MPLGGATARETQTHRGLTARISCRFVGELQKTLSDRGCNPGMQYLKLVLRAGVSSWARSGRYCGVEIQFCHPVNETASGVSGSCALVRGVIEFATESVAAITKCGGSMPTQAWMVRIVEREDFCFRNNTVAIGWARARGVDRLELTGLSSRLLSRPPTPNTEVRTL